MKTLLITNSNDAKVGMRLAGIEALVVDDANAALLAIKKAIADQTIGLILLTDQLARPLNQQIMDLKLSVSGTMILTIPDVGGELSDQIGQYVRKSIGIKY